MHKVTEQEHAASSFNDETKAFALDVPTSAAKRGGDRHLPMEYLSPQFSMYLTMYLKSAFNKIICLGSFWEVQKYFFPLLKILAMQRRVLSKT